MATKHLTAKEAAKYNKIIDKYVRDLHGDDFKDFVGLLDKLANVLKKVIKEDTSLLEKHNTEAEAFLKTLADDTQARDYMKQIDTDTLLSLTFLYKVGTHIRQIHSLTYDFKTELERIHNERLLDKR